jgi:hypothetical protein
MVWWPWRKSGCGITKNYHHTNVDSSCGEVTVFTELRSSVAVGTPGLTLPLASLGWHAVDLFRSMGVGGVGCLSDCCCSRSRCCWAKARTALVFSYKECTNHTDISTKDAPYLGWQQVCTAAVLSCFYMLLVMN